MRVDLIPATITSKPEIADLLQPYLRELSPYFGGSSDPDAVFEYPYLDAYWEEPNQRFPFLILSDGATAGFVFVNHHSRLEQANTRSIAEFYVLPQHRRNGIGKSAAQLAFNRFPDRWEVAILEGNEPARRFWLSTIRGIAGDQFAEHRTDSWNGSILTFEHSVDHQGLTGD